MTGGISAGALRQIGTLFESGTVAALTDAQLLERFVARRDESAELAFAALVTRHGPMVLGVCRRALADPGDADDAFQATFLILARKAGSVRVGDSLGRWLYGVSRKVAARARVVAARRPRGSGEGMEAVAADPPDPDGFEVRAILDEELARLPASYRAAVVLCDLGGLTHEEAARDLRCPVGTVKSRQARGRARLRSRLERRGLDPSSAILAPAVPAGLAGSAARLALAGISGSPAAGTVPAGSALLAREVLKAMTGIKLKLAAAAALSIGVAATGVGVLARPQGGGGPAPSRGQPPARDDGARRAPAVADLRDELEGARQRLAKYRQSGDPAAIRAQVEVDRLEAAAAEVARIVADAIAPAPESRDGRPAVPPRESRPARAMDRPFGPGRELAKVNLPDYVVGPPDILLVEVLEALPGRPITGERLIRPDGKISLGFYGELSVAGLTTEEVKVKVAGHLREFLNDEALGLSRTNGATGKVEAIAPARTDRIFVDVAAYNSQVYYVQGEVSVPGRLPITGNETVLDAINYAGGLLPSASKGGIRLVRPALPGAAGEHVLPVDWEAIVARGDASTNYQLKPGDRILVDRDPNVPAPSPATADAEARLRSVERKLDEVLKALDRLGKPADAPAAPPGDGLPGKNPA